MLYQIIYAMVKSLPTYFFFKSWIIFTYLYFENTDKKVVVSVLALMRSHLFYSFFQKSKLSLWLAECTLVCQ